MLVNADAHAVGGNRAVAQRLESAAEMRGQHAVDHQNSQSQCNAGDIEIFDFLHALERHVEQRYRIRILAQIDKQRRRELDPERTIGHIHHFIDQNLHNRAESQRHHRQIGTGHPQSGQGQHDAEQRGHNDADRQSRPETDIELEGQHTRRIGTDAQQRGMADRHFTGIAEHHIQPQSHNGKNRNRHQQVQIIGTGHHKGANNQRQQTKRPQNSLHCLRPS